MDSKVMKKIIIGILAIIFVALIWNFFVNAPTPLSDGTGAYGIIEYREGDCFPSGGIQFFSYSTFTGNVVFVKEIDLTKIDPSPSNSDKRKQFMEESDKISVKDGKYQARLEPGQYYLIKADTDGREVYGSGFQSTGVLVPQGPAIRKDFKLNICTSL